MRPVEATRSAGPASRNPMRSALRSMTQFVSNNAPRLASSSHSVSAATQVRSAARRWRQPELRRRLQEIGVATRKPQDVACPQSPARVPAEAGLQVCRGGAENVVGLDTAGTGDVHAHIDLRHPDAQLVPCPGEHGLVPRDLPTAECRLAVRPGHCEDAVAVDPQRRPHQRDFERRRVPAIADEAIGQRQRQRVRRATAGHSLVP